MRASEAMGSGIDHGRTPAITPDDLLWEQQYNRTPYENLRNAFFAMQQLDRDVPKTEVRTFAFRYIAGMGPSVVDIALERIESDRD